RGVGIAGAGVDVGSRERVEEVGAMRREGEVDDPRHAVLVDGRGRALDVVTGQPGELRFVAGKVSSRYFGVWNPGGIDQLGDPSDHLLCLVGGDTGQVDRDPVVARAADVRLVDAQRVDAPVDDGDGSLLNVGGA